MWWSQQERVTVTALGGGLLAGVLVLEWRQQRSLVRVAGSTAPMAETAWDGQLEAARAVDVNTADVAELERLPGIGPALAQRIVEERSRRGAFASPEELQRV